MSSERLGPAERPGASMSHDGTGWAEVRIPVREESDVMMARICAREFALREGLSESAAEALVIATSEIARNIVVHAGRGEVCVAAVQDGDRRGVAVVARDAGPGIPDPARALQDGYSTAGGLGLGLSSAQRLADSFELTSAAGEGTTVTITKWAR